ncbi:MAG: tyrosine-type recombinase/integrase [Pseudonocardia sp.]|nr:tyrosine-type recombinase/integrase [Pseudonocardia sp.]
MGHIRDRWKDPARKGKGRRWQVRYSVDGREKDGGSFDVKAVAQRRLVELESAVHRGAWVDPTDRTTVVEYARQWAAARPYRATTRRRVDAQIRTHLEGTALGSQRLVSVRPSDVQAWAGELSKSLAPSSTAAVVTVLKAIFAAAVLDRVIASSPVVRISLPRSEQPRLVPLTVAQVRELAAAVPARNRAMVIAQAGLGLRLGELLALRVHDVGFLGRSVRVEHQLAEGTRERVEPKTPRSRRTIPLPQVVADELSAHIARFPPLQDGSIFSGNNGQPYAHGYYGTVLSSAAQKLAAAEGSTFPADTTTHSLRHHYASVLLAAGESVVAVAERLGHDNATMVIRVYGHLVPGSESRTRKAVDAAWSSDSATSPTAQGRPG